MTGEPHYGVYRATVTANDDPEMRGRVKVATPISTTEIWAEVAMCGGDSQRFAPEIGERVVIAFEAGNAATPIVIGKLWSGAV